MSCWFYISLTKNEFREWWLVEKMNFVSDDWWKKLSSWVMIGGKNELREWWLVWLDTVHNSQASQLAWLLPTASLLSLLGRSEPALLALNIKEAEVQQASHLTVLCTFRPGYCRSGNAVWIFHANHWGNFIFITIRDCRYLLWPLLPVEQHIFCEG